jgi:large subunit ribosomal protein L3
MTGILGKKLGMTRVIQDDGRVIPITVVQCEPNIITQVKTVEKDGYPAIVLGISPYQKQYKNKKFHFSREFRIEENSEVKKGDLISVEMFQEGDLIRVTGVSKGKGFQGVVKRWHMAGGPKSHGSHFKREPGSVGARAKPGKIHRGKKLPGHMGSQTVTIMKSPIVYIDKGNNLIGVKGCIPGSINSFVSIRKISSK